VKLVTKLNVGLPIPMENEMDIPEIVKVTYRVSDIVTSEQEARGIKYVVLKDTSKGSFGFTEYETEEVGAYQTRMVADIAVQQLNDGRSLEAA
jgi:hypothetical protein